MSPLRRYGQYLTTARDSTIVQPATLPPARSSQVCGQCHSVWEHFDTADERRANAAGVAYRPGDDLASTRVIVQPTANLAAPTMRQLLEAYPGYVDAHAHVLLVPHDAQAGGRSSFGRRMGRHTPGGTWHGGERRMPAMSLVDRRQCRRAHPARAGINRHSCYNCHMPYTTYGLLRALRSHQISSPSVAVSVETGRPAASTALKGAAA